MPTKSNISRLDLEYWMKSYTDTSYGRRENDLTRITPIVNRDGWYFNRLTKLEWYEYKGEAFIPRGKGSFEYMLSLLNAHRLSERERAVYEEVIRLGPSKDIIKHIKKALDLDYEIRYLRSIRMEGYKASGKARRRLAEYKEKLAKGA